MVIFMFRYNICPKLLLTLDFKQTQNNVEYNRFTMTEEESGCYNMLHYIAIAR